MMIRNTKLPNSHVVNVRRETDMIANFSINLSLFAIP